MSTEVENQPIVQETVASTQEAPAAPVKAEESKTEDTKVRIESPGDRLWTQAPSPKRRPFSGLFNGFKRATSPAPAAEKKDEIAPVAEAPVQPATVDVAAPAAAVEEPAAAPAVAAAEPVVEPATAPVEGEDKAPKKKDGFFDKIKHAINGDKKPKTPGEEPATTPAAAEETPAKTEPAPEADKPAAEVKVGRRLSARIGGLIKRKDGKTPVEAAKTEEAPKLEEAPKMEEPAKVVEPVKAAEPEAPAAAVEPVAAAPEVAEPAKVEPAVADAVAPAVKDDVTEPAAVADKA